VRFSSDSNFAFFLRIRSLGAADCTTQRCARCTNLHGAKAHRVPRDQPRRTHRRSGS
jgi:hypothetical protein